MNANFDPPLKVSSPAVVEAGYRRLVLPSARRSATLAQSSVVWRSKKKTLFGHWQDKFSEVRQDPPPPPSPGSRRSKGDRFFC